MIINKQQSFIIIRKEIRNNSHICRPLLEAIHNGNLKEVRIFIGPEVLSLPSSQLYGYALLREAIEYKQKEIAKFLLNEGAAVNGNNLNKSNTALHLAVLYDYTDLVQLLLNRNADVNFANHNGKIPLHLAVTCGYEEVCHMLLRKNSNPNVRDSAGYGPLHYAAKLGSLEIAKELITYGADVNLSITLPMDKGFTPLHYATCNGHREIVKLLLQSGADANPKDKDGSTPLHIAAEKGHLGIAYKLIIHGASVNSSLTSSHEEGYTPLHFASRNENVEVAKLLIDNGAVINATAKDDLKPLHIAVQKHRKKMVPLLLGRGAEVDSKDKDGNTPLYFAAVGGSLAITRDILKHCPDVNIKSNKLAFYSVLNKQKEIAEHFLGYGFRVDPKDVNELLQDSVRNGHKSIVEDLLIYDTDVNTPYGEKCKKVNTLLHTAAGYTLLHTAARNGHKEIARLLVNYGASVNAKDTAGRTPMYYSILGGSTKISKILLANGVNVNDVFEPPKSFFAFNDHSHSEVSAGETALHLATLKGNKELIKLLICERANVNAVKLDGSTALHIAVNGSNEEIVELLLEHNANVNAMDKKVLSPLHLAITKENCKLTIVKTLLKYGADINCKDRLGETALHHFCRNKHLEGVKYLLDYGADINAMDNHGNTPLNIALAYIDGSESYFSKSIAIVEHIIRNMVKMLAAKMHVSDKNLILNTLSAHPGASHITQCVYKDHFLNFQRTCEGEMQEMRHQKISGNISFCDLLIKNLNRVAAYERNENIAQVLDSGRYKTKFPIYAEMLEMQVLRGKRRNELFECASKALYYCSKSILPYPVTQEILVYLGEKDLITLSKFYQQHFDSSDTS